MPLTSASALSDYLESQVLSWLKGTTMPAAPATTYLGLFTTNPADTGTVGSPADGTEASYAGYARQAITWGAIAAASSAPISDSTGQQIQNTAQITFPAVAGGTVTVTGVGIYSASSAGNLLAWIALGSSQAYAVGAIPTVNANNATLAVD